ncbi:hypothetical protein Sjap_010254 [Stephania japonica]|uniref:Uncharacterized protein n=1 Tax=Stephania japonica TaxID=461633 RepID=A0AAP0JB93_9MAGN
MLESNLEIGRTSDSSEQSKRTTDRARLGVHELRLLLRTLFGRRPKPYLQPIRSVQFNASCVLGRVVGSAVAASESVQSGEGVSCVLGRTPYLPLVPSPTDRQL